MGGCRCSFRECHNATHLDKKMHFFHYPVHDEKRCDKWIEHARKKEAFKELSVERLRNKVICQRHFKDNCFVNANKNRLLRFAIPTLETDGTEISEDTTTSNSSSSSSSSNSTSALDIKLEPINEQNTKFKLIDFTTNGNNYSFVGDEVVPTAIALKRTAQTAQAVVKKAKIISATLPDDSAAAAAAVAKAKFVIKHPVVCKPLIVKPAPKDAASSAASTSATPLPVASPASSVPPPTTTLVSKLQGAPAPCLDQRYARQVDANTREIKRLRQLLERRKAGQLARKRMVLRELRTLLPVTMYRLVRAQIFPKLADDSRLAGHIQLLLQQQGEPLLRLLCDEWKWKLPQVRQE